MPRRSKVTGLPPAVKAWLDQVLVEGNFSGYEQLSAELEKRGCAVSKSALHRYGSAFEASIARLKVATEQARAVVAASPDDAGDMTEALMRLTQQKVMQLVVDCEIDTDSVDMNKLALIVSRLSRSAIPVKRYQAEVKSKLRSTLDAAVKEAEGSGEGNTLAMLKRVRQEVYGIFDE
jgi:hypothetical protein